MSEARTPQAPQINGLEFLKQVESGQIETRKIAPVADLQVAEQIAHLLGAGLVSVLRMCKAIDTTIVDLDETFAAHGFAFRTGFTDVA